MLSISTQFHFVADLVAMLVAASGFVLAAVRGDLTRGRLPSRLLLMAGFVAFGAAAFVVGARLDRAAGPLALGVPTAAGALAVVIGAVTGWRGGRRSRRALVAGGVLGVVAGVAQAGSARIDLVDGLLLAAGLVLGVALAGAGRRSIATRVAAGAAATLLLVVLVLSVALSSVITRSVQQQALVSARDRTALQAGQLLAAPRDALAASRLVAADLERVFRPTSSGTGGLGTAAVKSAAVASRLTTLASFYPAGRLAFVEPGGSQISSGPLPAGLASLPVATGLGCGAGTKGSTGAESVSVLDGTAYALGAFAACAASPLHQVGTVVVVEAITAASLAPLRADPDQAMAVTGPTGVVARVGTSSPDLAAATSSTAGATARLVGGRVVSTAPLQVTAGAAVVSLVVSDPASSLAATTDTLDRTLVLIALGGTLLALVLAALTGDRITSGLRQLTAVARDIRGGGTAVRAGDIAPDEVGVLAGAFDAMVDSVEEKNAALQAAALDERRLRARMEAVVAGMTEALVAMDPDGLITDFNHAAADLTGLPAADALGRPALEVLAFAGEAGQALAGGLGGGEPWSGVAQIVTLRGDVVPVAVSSGTLQDPGRGLVMVLRDLRAEEQVERMKTEFLSRVGHELRTPLTGILGYADILSRREVPSEQARQWHVEILHAAKRQLRIVQLLEFFASAGAGRVVKATEPVDARELVEATVEGWRSRLAGSYEIATVVTGPLPTVRADRRWTTLALDELLDNAVKFSPDGGRIEVRVHAGGPGEVAVAVADPGIGMVPEDRERAFGAFEQGDPSDTRSFGGLGLGLAAVARIAAELGGRVTCESTLGHGTTMTLFLSVEEP